MSISFDCPGCGKRYLVKTLIAGKRYQCKCGGALRPTHQATPIETGTEVASPKMPSMNRGIDKGTFLHALSDAQSSTHVADRASVASKTSRVGLGFRLTTAMGPFAGRYSFIVLTVIVLLLANALLLAFSVSPLVAAILWSPVAILAVFYAAMAVDSNKMMVEIDEQQLAIRFLRRLPWPVRDKCYPLEWIQRTYVEHRQVMKPFFSSAHSNDTEGSYVGSRRLESVYVYRLMAQVSGHRWPICLATFEDQAIAISIVDFMESKSIRT